MRSRRKSVLCKDIHKRGHIWLVVVVSDHLMKEDEDSRTTSISERVVLDFESLTITQLMIDICSSDVMVVPFLSSH